MRIMYRLLFNESISLHICVSFARLNNSAWMSGLRPSSTAKQKSLVVHDRHSVPSIGQRRRFIGDKSGVTFWKYFADDDGLCLYVRGLFGQHMWLLAARTVYYLFCLFFFSFLRTEMIMRDNDDSWARCWRGSGVLHQVSHQHPFFFWWVAKKSKVWCDRVDVFISEPTYACTSSAHPCVIAYALLVCMCVLYITICGCDDMYCTYV